MIISMKAAAAVAAVAIGSALALPATAADLNGGWGKGSVKDGYEPNVPVRTAAGPCYMRTDIGYSLSNDPDVRFPVYDVTNGNYSERASSVSMDNTWLVEGGVGCGSGSNGFRGELVLGYHGARTVNGTPAPFYSGNPGEIDPLHMSVTSYTAMFNVYRDLGNFNNLTPYLGAGLGVAYHMSDDVYFTGSSTLPQIKGSDNAAFAWSLMAGVGYQISDRAILDVGYRYIDMGAAQSERSDTFGYVDPRVTTGDITAHEFKVGLRYHFGGSSDCCAAAPMK